MPTHTGKDSKGCFAQWGSQKKYYYECGNTTARKRAVAKADAQGEAIRASGYTGNQGLGVQDMPATMTDKRQFQVVTFNLKPVVRHETMGGKEFLVAPMVMLTEGVHAGTQGPLFYSANELKKLPQAWNHKPVVVYHPTVDEVTACTPSFLHTNQIGLIMNAAWDGKLKAEAWLEQDRLEVVDDRVLEAVNNKEMLELSTGLYSKQDGVEGVWNEEAYDASVFDIVPDHLAVLPDIKGACSIEDGAGFLRLNEDEGELVIIENDVEVTDQYIRIRQKAPALFKHMRMKWLSKSKGIKAVGGPLKKPPSGKTGWQIQLLLFVKEKWTTASAKKWAAEHDFKSNEFHEVENELSHEDIRMQLRDKVKASLDGELWPYVEEVYDDKFIYSIDGSSDFLAQAYTLTEQPGGVEEVTFVGLPIAVTKETRYVDSTGTVVANEDDDSERDNIMAKTNEKKKVIDSLIANEATQWTDDDREFLQKCEMSQLEKMVPTENEKEQRKQTVANAAKEGAKELEATATQNAQADAGDATPQKEMTADEYINNAPPNLRGMLRNMQTQYEQQKLDCIEAITNNPNNTFTEEQLQTKELDELHQIASLATTTKQNTRHTADYSGQADGATQNKEEALDVETLNFDKEPVTADA